MRYRQTSRRWRLILAAVVVVVLLLAAYFFAVAELLGLPRPAGWPSLFKDRAPGSVLFAPQTVWRTGSTNS